VSRAQDQLLNDTNQLPAPPSPTSSLPSPPAVLSPRWGQGCFPRQGGRSRGCCSQGHGGSGQLSCMPISRNPRGTKGGHSVLCPGY